jgi:hypothetical protein
MTRQRTLLPYRLARDLASELIMEEIDWLDDNEFIEAQIEKITRWEDSHQAACKLLTLLHCLMNEDVATALVNDLLHASEAVWLFEREFQFENGIALVPARQNFRQNSHNFSNSVKTPAGGVA